MASLKKYRIGIIGGGAWGTALAKVIGEKGHKVEIWCFETETVRAINKERKNIYFLPEAELPQTVSANTNLSEVADKKDFLIIATPSTFIIETVKKILHIEDIVEGKTRIGIITKGFVKTPKGTRLILETLENYLPGSYKGSLVYISGPSMATEVAQGKLTGLISASSNGLNSIKFRELLSCETLVVFSSFDIVGVQVSAAAKNIIAIAFGMLEALKELSPDFGWNTESLLIAAGLNEIQLLGGAMGSTHSETFTSIAGVGDLDVTCRSVYGRNRRFGREIFTHSRLDKYKNIYELMADIPNIGYLPEGVMAAECVHELSKELSKKGNKLKLPISSGVFRVLNKDLKPLDAVERIITTIAHGNKPNFFDQE